jgi:hypothetical protein
MATPPTFNVGEVLTAAQMNAIGLWKVTPTGVTNGTISNGVVTVGNAVASVTVSGAFTADFDNYLIVMNGTDASAANFLIQMTLSGASGSNYSYWYFARGYANQNGDGYANNVSGGIPLGLTGQTNESSFNATVFNPYNTQYTTVTTQGVGNDFVLMGGGVNRQAVSNTGFTLTPSSGTLTGGTIRVYGYRK